MEHHNIESPIAIHITTPTSPITSAPYLSSQFIKMDMIQVPSSSTIPPSPGGLNTVIANSPSSDGLNTAIPQFPFPKWTLHADRLNSVNANSLHTSRVDTAPVHSPVSHAGRSTNPKGLF